MNGLDHHHARQTPARRVKIAEGLHQHADRPAAPKQRLQRERKHEWRHKQRQEAEQFENERWLQPETPEGDSHRKRGQRGKNGGAESNPGAVQQAFDIQRVVEKDAERADGQVAVLVGDPGNEHLADRHHDETKQISGQ